MVSAKSKYNYTSVKERLVGGGEKPQEHEFNKQRARNWEPVSLKLPFLILFAFGLVCLIPALLVIRHFVEEDYGFTLVTSNHYTWTYGPTAVFILIASFWRLIDYHCRALTPWSELAKGPITADRSIFLDHVTPFILSVIYNAGKFKHFSVILTIAGFLLLKVVMLASTGLFFPSFVTVGPIDIQIVKTTRLDNITSFSNDTDPGLSPFYKTYAVIARNYSFPEGVTENLVYETFKSVDELDTPNTTYRAVTGVFIPQVTCSLIDASIPVNYSEYTTDAAEVNLPIQIEDDDTWTCASPGNITIKSLGVAGEVCPPRQLVASFGMENCSHSTGSNVTEAIPFLISLSDVRYDQTFDVSLDNYTYGDLVAPESWNITIPTVQAMLCQTSYSIGSAQVTYNMSGISQIIDVDDVSSSNQQLENLSNEGLAEILNYVDPFLVNGGITSLGASSMFGIVADSEYQYDEQPPDTVMELIAARAGADYEYLLNNPNTMIQAAEEVLTIMLLFIANDIIIQPTNTTFQGDTLTGQKEYTEERLQIQPESLYLMIAGLLLAFVMAIAVIFLRPRLTTSSSPETIASVSDILQGSPEVQQQIAKISKLDEETARELLQQHQYFTQKVEGQTLIKCSSLIEGNSAPQSEPASQEYFSPVTTRKIFLSFTLLLTCFLIAILQVLQHLSDNSTFGIVSLKDRSVFVITLFTRWLPALVMFLIATLFNSFDANTAILAPYSKMYAGPASYGSLVRPLGGQVPLVALNLALKNRYWSAFLTGAATIVGSVLSMIVSGLYSVNYVPQGGVVAVYSLDSFNLSYHQGISVDNATAATSSLIESQILSYPAFTYDELVFPSVTFSDTNSSTNSSTPGLLIAQLPALRPNLSCESIDSSLFNYTFVYEPEYDYTQVLFNGTIPLPENCHFGSSTGDQSTLFWTNNDVLLTNVTNSTLIGFFSDLHVGPYNAMGGMDFSETYPQQPDNPPGCPSVLLVYGYLDGNDDSKSVLTAQSCYQTIQRVQSNVTFVAPYMSIPSEIPPVADESTVETLSSGPDDATAFWWRIEMALEWSFQLLNATLVDPDTPGAVSNFFRGAIFGKDPLPLESIAAGSPITNYTPEELFDHIQSFYRRYMAQYISGNMRMAVNTAVDSESLIVATDTVQATFVPSAGTPIMVQNTVPKLVLQIMLGVMIVLSALAWALGHYHNVIPWNPCSIAGIMVLVAGSRMCDPEIHRVGMRSSSRSPRASIEELEMVDLRPSEHEMSLLSEQHNSGHRDAENRPLKEVSPSPSSRNLNSDLRQRRFRLGWWNGNVFLGNKTGHNPKLTIGAFEELRGNSPSSSKPAFSTQPPGQKQLRYGIDMI